MLNHAHQTDPEFARRARMSSKAIFAAVALTIAALLAAGFSYGLSQRQASDIEVRSPVSSMSGTDSRAASKSSVPGQSRLAAHN